MKRLLIIEWLKWSKNKVFWLILALYFLLLPAGVLIIRRIFGEIPPPFPEKDIYTRFPEGWDFLTYSGSWQSFFLLGFLMIILVSTEYSQRTLKQSIIQGLTRTEWFFGKLGLMSVITLFVTVYMMVIGLVFGITTTPEFSMTEMWGQDGIIPRFMLMTMGYMMFAWLVVTIFKRTGISIVMYFAFIMFLEPLLRAMSPDWLDQLYPMNALADLCPMPFYGMVKDFALVNGKNAIQLLPAWQAVITSLIYTSIFGLLIYRMIKKSDL